MLAYSIEAARASGEFDEVYVCTESPEIAEVARHYGALVPFLMPEELAGDAVASHAPIQHLAAQLESEGRTVDTIVCLQPTSPLRSPEDIRAGLHRFDETGAPFVVSVTLIDPHYFHWAVRADEDGQWGFYFGQEFMRERIYLPHVFRPNGSIKIADYQSLRETGNFFGPGLQVVETPEERSVHVALEPDFRYAEALLGAPVS